MSQKPVVNPQECDPSTLGLARKPRPALKRKPQTEVVVQLGPFTDGQITAPEMVRPLEGPTEWLIKPKTGEIVPFDGSTPEKDVIRKYITVGAQDNDVPENLPKLSEGYVVERVNQDALPSMDGPAGKDSITTVRVIEREGPSSVECKDMPPPPPPPAGESEDDECKCPPPEEEECLPPKEEDKCETPIDAIDDCASTKEDCPVIIDVLKNDIGCDDMKITEASAENGTVEIRGGKLHYTPNEGFSGEDVISYTIGDENCLTDTAHVYMKVEATGSSGTGSDCDVIDGGTPYTPDPCVPTIPTPACPITACPTDGSVDYDDPKLSDHEYSSGPYSVESIMDAANEKLQAFLDQSNEYINSKTSWSANFGSSGFDCAIAAPAEEAAAVC